MSTCQQDKKIARHGDIVDGRAERSFYLSHHLVSLRIEKPHLQAITVQKLSYIILHLSYTSSSKYSWQKYKRKIQLQMDIWRFFKGRKNVI